MKQMHSILKSVSLLFISLFFCQSLCSQNNKYTISGYMQDADTGEKLIGANIFDSKSLSGTTTNTYGFFSLTLPGDSVFLTSSYIGYEPQVVKFYLNQDTTIDISFSSSVELETVVVEAEKIYRIEEDAQMSTIDVPIETIKKIPQLMGETDVLKTLQLLPGVQSGGEGQNGLYVRGGSPDQNLILLDGVPVYNVSHVLGIFSVFNADAIKNVKLTKGGFPARYGGRLSSVLEINMKEGNNQEFHGEGSIGSISSKLTLEGPIIKDKTSFIVSARRTYIDVFMAPFIAAANRQSETDFGIKLFFYDLNAKINHKINDKHRLYLSAYSGADVFGNEITETDFKTEGGIDWGNLISAARWNYKINKKLFSNTTLTYSKYDIDIFASFEDTFEEITETFSANYRSGIKDIAGKIDFDYIPSPSHYIKFGGGATNHTYSPGALVLKSDSDEISLDTLIGSQDTKSMEYALYLEDEITLGGLKANVGVHTSAFDVDDQTYFSVQPRLGLRYLLPNKVALKASFATMTQYINLLTSEALSLPTDLWVPSTARIKPQQSWQVAAGIATTFKDKYEFSIECYYKEMDNVLSFREGASFLLDLSNDWQDKVTQGKGESYGIEVFLQKKIGKTNGWLGYTLAWNNRQFDEINGGKEFPFRYDRRHDLSLVVIHELNERITLSGAWIFGTGNAITLPIFKYPDGKYDWNPNVNNNFREIQSLGEKNKFRMTNYHRLDFSAEWKKPLEKRKWKNFESSWVLSVYNAYYHRNPYYVFSDTDRIYDSNGNLIDENQTFKEVTILPIIPSMTYKFKF